MKKICDGFRGIETELEADQIVDNFKNFRPDLANCTIRKIKTGSGKYNVTAECDQ